jgi:hypothetical protein
MAATLGLSLIACFRHCSNEVPTEFGSAATPRGDKTSGRRLRAIRSNQFDAFLDPGSVAPFGDEDRFLDVPHLRIGEGVRSHRS